MQYKLNSALTLSKLEDDSLIISVPDLDPMFVIEDIDVVLDILNYFKEPSSIENAINFFTNKKHTSSIKIQNIIQFMRSHNIIKESSGYSDLDNYHMEKYCRQVASFNSLPQIEFDNAVEIQKRLDNSHLCIIGLGGTGSHYALGLASIGIEELTIIDFDKVELSNTSRQILYNENDVGFLKVDVATEKLRQYNSKLKIHAYNMEINSTDVLEKIDNKNFDLLVLCADSPRGEIQYIIDKYALKYDIPWLGFGPFNHSKILVGPLIIPSINSYEDLFPKDDISFSDQTIMNINSNYTAGIIDPYNAISAQFALIESIKFLTKYENTQLINRRYYVDTDSWKIDHVDYR